MEKEIIIKFNKTVDHGRVDLKILRIFIFHKKAFSENIIFMNCYNR